MDLRPRDRYPSLDRKRLRTCSPCFTSSSLLHGLSVIHRLLFFDGHQSRQFAISYLSGSTDHHFIRLLLEGSQHIVTSIDPHIDTSSHQELECLYDFDCWTHELSSVWIGNSTYRCFIHGNNSLQESVFACDIVSLSALSNLLHQTTISLRISRLHKVISIVYQNIKVLKTTDSH